ncbi:YqcI/YcgG family protein [Aquibacillus koreensis]|uniref:YqcI/YcgG family protein n=1 Tax=Aquibacillus koreensis TaxID=279446 RepID=UPI003898EB19
MSVLYTDNPTNRKELAHWESETLERFERKMTDKQKPFPCIPATIGFSTNQLRYGFVGDPRNEETISDLADMLRNYTETSREYGNYTSLIVFYDLPKDMKSSYSVEDYEQLFWKQLSALHEIDDVDWPEDIPTDPHNPIWEFCFHGERFFMYCATPAHVNRQSRYFDVMMLAITPRWVLEEFNQSPKHASKIKTGVRNRLKKYDSLDVHPDLNSYGAEDNFEWRQYYLRDDDTALSKCPYHKFIRLFKK